MNRFPSIPRTWALASAMLLSGAGATAQVAAPEASTARVGQDLACPHSGNCINSLADGGLAPLRFTGSASQAKAALLATLAGLQARLAATRAGFADLQVDPTLPAVAPPLPD